MSPCKVRDPSLCSTSCLSCKPFLCSGGRSGRRDGERGYVGRSGLLASVCRGRGRAAQGAWETARLCHSQVRRSRRPARGARGSRAQIAKRRRGGSRTIIRFLSRSPSLPKTLSELKGVPILKMKLLVPGYPFRCAKSLKTCISDLCIPPTIAGQTAPWSF